MTNNDELRSAMSSLVAEGGLGAEDASFVGELQVQDTVSLKELRQLQQLVAAAKIKPGSSVGITTKWLNEIIKGSMLNLPSVKSSLSPEEIAAQDRRREILLARAAEREYQSMVAPLNRRSTNQKRRQIYEQKLQYQLGVPVNMVLGAGTAFLLGYYGGMHYFADHNSALGVGCVCLFIMLFIEMMLFTIRSL